MVHQKSFRRRTRKQTDMPGIMQHTIVLTESFSTRRIKVRGRENHRAAGPQYIRQVARYMLRVLAMFYDMVAHHQVIALIGEVAKRP